MKKKEIPTVIDDNTIHDTNNDCQVTLTETVADTGKAFKKQQNVMQWTV